MCGDRVEREPFERMLSQLWERHPAPARLLGVGVRLRDLKSPQQPDLFPEEREKALRQHRGP